MKLCLSALVAASAVAASLPAYAFPIVYPESVIGSLTTITKAQAIAIALKRVGGGKAVSAEFTNDYHILHWQIDIVNGSHAYEVWVSPTGAILKVIVEH